MHLCPHFTIQHKNTENENSQTNHATSASALCRSGISHRSHFPFLDTFFLLRVAAVLNEALDHFHNAGRGFFVAFEILRSGGGGGGPRTERAVTGCRPKTVLTARAKEERFQSLLCSES